MAWSRWNEVTTTKGQELDHATLPCWPAHPFKPPVSHQPNHQCRINSNFSLVKSLYYHKIIQSVVRWWYDINARLLVAFSVAWIITCSNRLWQLRIIRKRHSFHRSTKPFTILLFIVFIEGTLFLFFLSTGNDITKLFNLPCCTQPNLKCPSPCAWQV